VYAIAAKYSALRSARSRCSRSASTNSSSSIWPSSPVKKA
jgi:hypothetical protein